MVVGRRWLLLHALRQTVGAAVVGGEGETGFEEGLDGVGVDGVVEGGDREGPHVVEQAVQAARLAVAAGARGLTARLSRGLGCGPSLPDLLHEAAGVDGGGGGVGGVGDDDAALRGGVRRAEADGSALWG